jgi:hypothetical protein
MDQKKLSAWENKNDYLSQTWHSVKGEIISENKQERKEGKEKEARKLTPVKCPL